MSRVNLPNLKWMIYPANLNAEQGFKYSPSCILPGISKMKQ